MKEKSQAQNKKKSFKKSKSGVSNEMMKEDHYYILPRLNDTNLSHVDTDKYESEQE